MLIFPSQLLLQTLLWIDGRKTSGLLSYLTDLPQSFFRKNRNFKPSTLKSFDKKLIDNIKLKDPNFSFENLPSLLNGYRSDFEDFIFVYFKEQLPLTVSLAKKIDKLNADLIIASEKQSFRDYKLAMLSSAWLAEEGYWQSENNTSAEQRKAFEKLEDFDAARNICIGTVANIFMSFFAALDIEFCSVAYGTKLKLRPLFIDLLLKVNFEVGKLESAEVVLPARDRFNLPSRRLLELTHAIYYFAKNKKWPNSPIGRNNLAKVVGYEETIGGFFDGTKKLKTTDYVNISSDLDKNVGNKSEADVAIPLLFAATFWQHTLLAFSKDYKIKSFTIGNDLNHKIWWEYHHKKWASQLQSGENDWPTWLDN